MAKEQPKDFDIPHVMVGKDAEEIAKRMKAHIAELNKPVGATTSLTAADKKPEVKPAAPKPIAVPVSGGVV